MQVTPIWDQICNQMQVVPPGCQICNTKNYSSLMDSIAWVWCAIGQFFIKTIKDFDLCLSQVHIYIENTPSYLVCFRTSLACFIWLSFKKEPKVRRRKSEVWYLRETCLQPFSSLLCCWLWEPFSHHLPLITSHCRVDQKTNTDPSLEAQQPISPEEFNLSLSK